MAAAAGHEGGVSERYVRSLKANFSSEASTVTAQPVEHARASQSSEKVRNKYMGNLHDHFAKKHREDPVLMPFKWPKPHQWWGFDEVGLSSTAKKIQVFAEKGAAVQRRIKKAGGDDALAKDTRKLNTSTNDRSVHECTVGYTISPDPVDIMPVNPVIVHHGVLMSQAKIMYKEGPLEKPKKLSDLSKETGRPWCVYTNNHGGSDLKYFRAYTNLVVSEGAKKGLGKGGLLGVLQADHDWSRNDNEAMQTLEDNGFTLAGPPAHGSHWASACDCGWNLFADNVITEMIADWERGASAGQKMGPMDITGIIVRLVHRCRSGDLQQAARESVIQSFACTGLLTGKVEDMTQHARISGISSQFVSSQTTVGEAGRREKASERARGKVTRRRESDGALLEVKTADDTAVGAIRTAVFEQIFDKEVIPAQEVSKLLKQEKVLAKKRFALEDMTADDIGDEGEEEQQLERGAALNSSHGFFYTETMQTYLDQQKTSKAEQQLAKMVRALVRQVVKPFYQYVKEQIKIHKSTEAMKDRTKRHRKAYLALERSLPELDDKEPGAVSLAAQASVMVREQMKEKAEKEKEEKEKKAAAAVKKPKAAAAAAVAAARPKPLKIPAAKGSKAAGKKPASKSPEEKPAPKRRVKAKSKKARPLAAAEEEEEEERPSRTTRGGRVTKAPKK